MKSIIATINKIDSTKAYTRKQKHLTFIVCLYIKYQQQQMPKTKRDTHNKTQKTIKELKSSIDSIEKMIEKSQELLKSTRPLQPREVRSDSVELRFNSHSKSKSKEKSYIKIEQGYETLPHNMNTNAFKQSRRIIDKCIPREKSINVMNIPQKTQTDSKGKFQLDFDLINSSNDQMRIENDNNILISEDNRPISPINPISHHQKRQPIDKYFLDSSFATVQSSNNNKFSQRKLNDFKRLNTQTLNDSWEANSLYNSIEKNRIQNREQNKHHQGTPRKIILKKKVRRINNYGDYERERKKSEKKNYIFRNEGKEGRYSYYKQLSTANYFSNTNTNESAGHQKDQNFIPFSPNSRNSVRMATLSSAREPCGKFLKESHQMGLDEFLKKVKRYGFVERYLSKAEIGCIYEYLCRSSIPQYKWPLYVVDQVYDKMKQKNKN